MHKQWNEETMPSILKNTNDFLAQYKKITQVISIIKELDLSLLNKKYRELI